MGVIARVIVGAVVGVIVGLEAEDYKLKCAECGWIGVLLETDKVIDPRPIEGTTPDVWSICPHCRTPENFASLCDEPGCEKGVTCGTPTPNGGYRQTCSEHKPQSR